MLDKIFVILVLYQTKLEESKTIKSLNEVLDLNFNIFVYDNSPIKQYEKDNFELGKLNIHYFHDESNLGLSTAYNYALNLAQKCNKTWLLLLDQDSTLTQEYIVALEKTEEISLPYRVVAIIPKVLMMSNNQAISPCKIGLGGLTRPININTGLIEQPISAINSGTLLKVNYMVDINGFSKNYSLDMLDHWYFRKLYNDGYKSFLLSATIYQELSVYGSIEENMSIERYQQILKAESNFISEQNFIGVFIFRLRLFFRFLKQLNFKNKRFSKFSLYYAFGFFK